MGVNQSSEEGDAASRGQQLTSNGPWKNPSATELTENDSTPTDNPSSPFDIQPQSFPLTIPLVGDQRSAAPSHIPSREPAQSSVPDMSKLSSPTATGAAQPVKETDSFKPLQENNQPSSGSNVQQHAPVSASSRAQDEETSLSLELGKRKTPDINVREQLEGQEGAAKRIRVDQSTGAWISAEPPAAEVPAPSECGRPPPVPPPTSRRSHKKLSRPVRRSQPSPCGEEEPSGKKRRRVRFLPNHLLTEVRVIEEAWNYDRTPVEPNLYNCDLCERQFVAGLAGFEVYWTANEVEEFDVCEMCKPNAEREQPSYTFRKVDIAAEVFGVDDLLSDVVS
ncbi:hypothetical protein CYMTET_25149 [Cymbomonas tetramitiformis]|uniref:Uncharacterized protein n=1 Tax=Cymbomonas tetramitiformis TaxID=36881 RepID=A0AAE0FV47_9CHLO|nr:hypothetical protein CYMTET_25149 [Cymbomonas tetramitiformis]